MISKRYEQEVIILSPLKQSARQNLDKCIEYGYPHKTLFVDSDGGGDIQLIEKIIKENENFLITAIFRRIDVIYKALEFMDEVFIIVEEFHNISKSNITNESDNFYEVLHSDSKMMFMPATPRVYEVDDDDIECPEIFGDVYYNMSFSHAIENKYVTDYKIWLPSILEDNDQLNRELRIYVIER